MQVEGETLRLQLWDTAGQERFRALIPSYVRDADACLIVIDVSLRSSLEGVDKWLDFVREARGQEALIFLVGNKSDIGEREVPKKELEEYAEKNRYPYIEVSAKSGTNIHLLFRKISERLIEGKTGAVKPGDGKKEQPAEQPPHQHGLTLKKEELSVGGRLRQCQC